MGEVDSDETRNKPHQPSVFKPFVALLLPASIVALRYKPRKKTQSTGSTSPDIEEEDDDEDDT